jgi:arylsulfatase
MPTVEQLANSGLCYNHFHTTALYSPTRAALLSGRAGSRVGSTVRSVGSNTGTGVASWAATGAASVNSREIAEKASTVLFMTTISFSNR